MSEGVILELCDSQELKTLWVLDKAETEAYSF